MNGLTRIKSMVCFAFVLLMVVGSTAFGDLDLGNLMALDGSVQIKSSMVSFDRRTGQFSTNVTTTNISSDAIVGPIYLVIDSINPATITVANGNGVTTNGKAYFTILENGEMAPGAAISVRVAFNNPQRLKFTFSAKAYGIQILGPAGGVFTGKGGVTVTVPPGACNQEVLLSIEQISEDEVGKDTPPGYIFLGAVHLDINDVILNTNADITIPCPTGVTQDAEIYVVELIEYAGFPMFMMVDSAIVQGDKISSQAPAFPGILGTGTYTFLWGENAGWVGGQVTHKSNGAAVPNAVVTLSGGYFLDITDGSGNYMLPAWAGNFVVVAFDDLTAEHGEKQGYMPSNGASVVCNVQIGESSGSVQDELTNGDFETGNLTGWVLSGEGSVISQLGPIKPYQGNYMGMISSGGAALGGASSALEQTFTVPAGVTTLILHYNFVSEEYPEFVGSIYNDVFNATLHTPDGSREVAFNSVNTATWYPVSGIDFPGGDNTCGQTGWLEASIDVSQYAGTDDTLTLTVHDVGDTIYDSVVLLDEIKLTFSTIEINTGFDVSLDGFTFSNVGNHIPDDSIWNFLDFDNTACLGMSAYAQSYYVTFVKGKSNPTHLSELCNNGVCPYIPTLSQWSAAISNFAPILLSVTGWISDEVAISDIFVNMFLTNAPIVVGLMPSSGPPGHAVLAYRIVVDEKEITIYVYDPNYPGDSSRKIVYDKTTKEAKYLYFEGFTWFPYIGF